MKHRITFKQLVWVCITVVLASLAVAQTAFAQARSQGPSQGPSKGPSKGKGTIVEMDRISFQEHLKALGY